MSIFRPCYANRTDVQRAPDFKDTDIDNVRIDRAMQSVADTIEGHLHRTFYPIDTTYRFDWPNYAYAYPWRLWLDNWDLVVMTQLQSPYGTTIPLSSVLPYMANRKPGFPIRRIELDRSTTAAWGAGPTPQLSIWVTGTFGFTADAEQAGTLAATANTGDATITVSDGSQVGPGDVLILGYGRGAVPFPQAQYAHTFGAIAPYTGERVLVTERSFIDSGQAQQSGCSTASTTDNLLTVTTGSLFSRFEIIRLDSEQMLITSISGNVLTVQRGWNATIPAQHGGVEVWVSRSLSVQRGQLGTTAATWANGTAVYRHRPPQKIRDLAIAESVNQVMQETSGYARTVGAGEMAMPAPGLALADMWDEAVTTFGRKARARTI